MDVIVEPIIKSDLRREESWWDSHFLDLAHLCSRPSRDPRRQVGAVIADTMHRVIGTGYNGFPRRVRDAPERYADKLVKSKLVVHAEANAILNASAPSLLSGSVMYCTSHPCSECAKLIVQAGITRLVCPTMDATRSQEDRDDASFAAQMFVEAGVKLDAIPRWEPGIRFDRMVINRLGDCDGKGSNT